MGHLYWFNLKKILRSKEEMFWPLLFPLILGTLFSLTFGTGDLTIRSNIPVALVREGNQYFETFLEGLSGELLLAEEMEEDAARDALERGTVEGIFFSGSTPALTVAASGINESILEVLLNTYLENQQMMEDIGAVSPLRFLGAANALTDYQECVKSVTVTGNEMNNSLNYYFSLIAMACLFGSFMGLTSALQLRGDQSPLAARRSVVPAGRLGLVISEMLSVFTVQFGNICVLLGYLHFLLGISFGDRWPLLFPVCVLGSMTGVAMGIFVGSLRMKDGLKNGLLVSASLIMSFLSGLMFGNMKNLVEEFCPLLNRVNPAALISDAFYSISVYENLKRYRENLLILAGITAALVAVSYWKLRRERYDSI